MQIFMSNSISTEELLAGLKAAGESTRLRLLVLLAEGELNVKDLTRILGQSQPRISRHLKLLTEAGLIERYREGSWVFFRLAEATNITKIMRSALSKLDQEDPELVRDRARALSVKQERADLAQNFFKEHAADWDKIRALHVAEAQVEEAMSKTLGAGPFDLLIDIGTGTGRILELFANRFRRGIGIDINHDMLAYARTKMEKAGLSHCQIRQGDLFHLPFDDDVADAVVIHQVLHFLDNPAEAIYEAGRVLKPGGIMLIVDFAPHELDFLREDFAHQRLGFEKKQISQWISRAGLVLKAHHDLKPGRKAGVNKLTVSLWQAKRRKRSTQRSSTAIKTKLEVTL